MKKISLIIGLVVAVNLAFTQEKIEILDNYKVDSLLLDFAVPDIPAFKALGTDPSDILRPSDVQKFAVSFEPFFNGTNAVIPANFAVDFAPWKTLSGDKWTVEDYRTSKLKRILYNSSFSFGSVRESEDNPASKLAVGYRVKITGKNADLLMNDKIYDFSDVENKLQAVALNKWRSCNDISVREYNSDTTKQKEFKEFFEKNIDLNQFLIIKGLCFSEYENSNDLKEEFERFKEDKRAFASKDNGELVFEGNLKSLIEDFNKNSWNASRTDFAISLVGASSDSLLENIQYNNLFIWVTQSLRLGSQGQLLVGGTFQSPEELDAKIFTGSARAYYGSDQFRGYLEYQIKNRNEENMKAALWNLGVEFRLLKDFWLQYYGGIEDVYDSEKSRFRSSLNLKYSFNKDK